MKNYIFALLFALVLPLSAQTSILDWDNHDGGPGGAPNAWQDASTSASIAVDGVTFDMNITGDLEWEESADPRYASRGGGYSFGNPSDDGVLDLDVDWNSASDNITYTVNFSEALTDFSFGIVDIDARFSTNGAGSYYSAYRDTVRVIGFGAGGDVYADITFDPLAPANHIEIVGTNNNILRASQTAFDLNNPLDDPLTTLSFNEAISGFEIRYGNRQFNRNQLISDGYQVDDPITAPTYSDPARQLIRIHDFSWDTVPEPSSMVLLGLGLVGFAIRRKR